MLTNQEHVIRRQICAAVSYQRAVGCSKVRDINMALLAGDSQQKGGVHKDAAWSTHQVCAMHLPALSHKTVCVNLRCQHGTVAANAGSPRHELFLPRQGQLAHTAAADMEGHCSI